MYARPQPLAGLLVVELARYLPVAYAGRELARLGARVVRVEPPEGDPLRRSAPAWDEALRRGKESVVCYLRSEPQLARALCARADVVLAGFRPGVAERLGVEPEVARREAVYCSVTGFGSDGEHAARAGHDLNYLGWAGVLEDTAPALPPLPLADLAAGALAAVADVLAALLHRAATGEGARLEISMTHRVHELVSYRLEGDPLPLLLTGGLACYAVYETGDGRHLTVGALEPRFFSRLCDLLRRPELAELQYGEAQSELASELSDLFRSRPLDEWLALFQHEDVCVGPVSTRVEAHARFGLPPLAADDEPLGARTAAWRAELGL